MICPQMQTLGYLSFQERVPLEIHIGPSFVTILTLTTSKVDYMIYPQMQTLSYLSFQERAPLETHIGPISATVLTFIWLVKITLMSS